MPALVEEIEAVGSVLEEIAREPLPPRAEGVAAVIQRLDEVLGSAELARVRQLTSSLRARIARDFERVADNLRVMQDVGEQMERLGGEAPWALEFAEAVVRMERQLKQRGLPLGPSKASPPKVIRHPITGEFFVSQLPAPDTDPATPPRLEDTLRSLIATATSDRVTRIPDVMLAAQMLDQDIEHLRPLVAQERKIANLRGEPSTRADELAQVLREAEAALEHLTFVLEAEAARVALAEPGESIPFEQLQREPGL